MPRTKLGRWAGGLALADLVLLAVLIIAFNTEFFGEGFHPGTVGGLVLWILTAVASLAALVTGTMSLIRFKDYTGVVIASSVFAVLTTVLLTMGAMPQA